MISKLLFACAALCAPFLCEAGESVFADDFKSYPDFDPGLRNWQLLGVAGEVVDGAYMFTGVTEKSSEYWDIAPEYAKALVRDFQAGPKLKIDAVMRACPHKFDVFDPGKGMDSLLGLVVMNQPLVRRNRPPSDAPLLELVLSKSASGVRSASFRYSGKPDIAFETKTPVQLPSVGWRDNVDYSFSIILSDGAARGVIKDGSRTVFESELRSKDLQAAFAKAYPGFGDLRMTGRLSFFKADSLGSSPGEEKILPFAIPAQWTIFANLNDAEKLPAFARIPEAIPGAKASSVSIESGKPLDLGAILGGHKTGRAAALFAKVSAKEAGLYAINCKADWFWRFDVNGKTIVNLLKTGNGASKSEDHVFVFPLRAGENLVEIVVGSGSDGWALALETPAEAKTNAALAKLHIYGGDAILWNLDRLLDDIAKLKRDGIAVDGLEARIVETRKSVAPATSSRAAAKYDPFLDDAYAKVYDAYRALSLKDAIAERKALAAALGSSENGKRVAELEKLLPRLKEEARKGDSAAVEKTAGEAQRILDACKKLDHGFREGVSRGGNFGRFGWMTSASIGEYSSGDGLLANQVLSDGALLRQYQSSASNGEPWLLRFRFDGAKDAAKAAEIASLKTLGENVAVQFGYEPTKFYSGSTPDGVKVKEINWIHKKFSYDGALLVDMCLASPALLLESASKQFVLSNPSTGAFSMTGWLNADGKAVSRPIDSDGVIYDAAKDSKLGSDWILLWSEENSVKDLTGHFGSVPVQIVFQRQPEKIERDGASIVVTLGKTGALWLCTPFGARLQPTGNWAGDGMPPSAVAACDLAGRCALAYPQGCHEFYRLSDDGKRVDVIDSFEYRLFKDNDWNVEPLELAPLPPLLSLMAGRGFDATLPEGLFDLGYPGVYGPLLAVKGSQVRYSLPVPQNPFMLLPANLEAPKSDSETLKRYALNDVEGARFRLYSEPICREWHSLNFPIARVSKAWSYLDPAYKGYLKGLFAYNMEASSGYRSNRVWRSLVEPYSGRKYFYSFSIKVDNPGDVGVFGDRGYGIGGHLLQLDAGSALPGNYETLRKLWRDDSPLAPDQASRDGKTLTVDKMLGYVKDVHDWAWMDDGSNDCGDNGPVVDCAQLPYGGHAALLRMAKTLGDSDAIANASYHLAKSQLPLISRLAFNDYGRENGLLGVDCMNAGFREFLSPKCFANSPMLVKDAGKNSFSEYCASYECVLNYAFVDSFDIYFPYARYIWNDLRYYERLRQVYLPNTDYRKGSKSGDAARYKFLLFDGTPASKLRGFFDNMTDGSIFWIRDGVWRENMPLLLAAGSPIALSSWTPLAAPEFFFSPSKKQAEMKFASVPAPCSLEALSSKKPRSVALAGGQPLAWTYDPASYRLSVKIPAGGQTSVLVSYDEIDAGHFTPIPLPPPVKAPPSLREEFLPRSFERAPAFKEAKPQTLSKNQDAPFFVSDFSGAQQNDLRYAGAFSFNDWGNSKQKPSGGLTGAYPSQAGTPSLSLEVTACSDNFSGRGSPALKPAAAKGDELLTSGKVMRSANYRGNNPMLFLWLVDKDGKGKPVFFDMAAPAKPGEWQSFEFVLPWSEELAKTEKLILNLTSRKLQGASETSGSIYYKDIKLSVRKASEH